MFPSLPADILKSICRELPIVVAQSVLGVKLSRKAKVLQISNYHNPYTHIYMHIHIYIYQLNSCY